MKKILNWVLTLEPMVHAMAFCGLCVLPARAQEPAKQWYDNIKFSGYGMLQYQGQDKEGEKSNTFNLRILRLILDGKAGDFDWRVQLQGTSNTGPGQPTVQLVDLYAEWAAQILEKIRQANRGQGLQIPSSGQR